MRESSYVCVGSRLFGKYKRVVVDSQNNNDESNNKKNRKNSSSGGGRGRFWSQPSRMDIEVPVTVWVLLGANFVSYMWCAVSSKDNADGKRQRNAATLDNLRQGRLHCLITSSLMHTSFWSFLVDCALFRVGGLAMSLFSPAAGALFICGACVFSSLAVITSEYVLDKHMAAPVSGCVGPAMAMFVWYGALWPHASLYFTTVRPVVRVVLGLSSVHVLSMLWSYGRVRFFDGEPHDMSDAQLKPWFRSASAFGGALFGAATYVLVFRKLPL